MGGTDRLKRFEEIGINTLSDLATYQAEDIAEMVASMLRTSCWKNSPQAKAAIEGQLLEQNKGCNVSLHLIFH